LSENCLIIGKIQQDITHVRRYLLKVVVIIVRFFLLSLEISRKIFEKHSNIKFHETPSGASWAVPCGGRDRQTWRSY